MSGYSALRAKYCCIIGVWAGAPFSIGKEKGARIRAPSNSTADDLLDPEPLGLDRLVVDQHFDLVIPHRPAVGLADVELGGRGTGGLDGLHVFLHRDRLAVLADEGPARLDGGRAAARRVDRDVDGVVL